MDESPWAGVKPEAENGSAEEPQVRFDAPHGLDVLFTDLQRRIVALELAVKVAPQGHDPILMAERMLAFLNGELTADTD